MSCSIYATPASASEHLTDGNWFADALEQAELGSLPLDLGSGDIPTLRGLAAMFKPNFSSSMNPFTVLIEMIVNHGGAHVEAIC
jgi:hypothetical protein